MHIIRCKLGSKMSMGSTDLWQICCVWQEATLNLTTEWKRHVANVDCRQPEGQRIAEPGNVHRHIRSIILHHPCIAESLFLKSPETPIPMSSSQFIILHATRVLMVILRAPWPDCNEANFIHSALPTL